MRSFESIITSGWIVLVLAQNCPGADSGKITGRLDTGGQGNRVWAITSDCLKSYETLTQRDGRYVFDGLPAGVYKLMATAPGLWQEPTKDIVLRPDATVQVNLWMQLGGAEPELSAPIMSPLHGIIVDSANQPVWGATINDLNGRETTSRADGRFGFCSIFSSGKFDLIIKRSDYETKTVSLDAGAGKYSDGKLKIALRKRTGETISTPRIPIGPVAGTARTQYKYSATGSVASLGSRIQYAFSWHKGGVFFWLPVGVTSDSNAWTECGTYPVSVRARRQNDPTIISKDSPALNVTIACPPDTSVGVAVSPPTSSLYASQTLQFTAKVRNATDTAVTWKIWPDGTGHIDGSGMYTAPASFDPSQTVMVFATSAADRTAYGKAILTILSPISVDIAPRMGAIDASQMKQFTATVSSAADMSVTWSSSPIGVGSIDSMGLYTAPASLSSGRSVQVTATSVADPTKKATAYLTIFPSVNLRVRPSAVTLSRFKTQQFTATSPVWWSIGQNDVGSISLTGLYTPPESVTTQQTVTVVATSRVNPTATAKAIVTLIPAPHHP